MARNKVDLCIFCGEAPCACNAPAQSAPKKRAAKPKPEVPIVEERGVVEMTPPASTKPKTSFKNAMKAAAASAPPPPPPPKPKPTMATRQRQVNEADALFAAAVRALGPLLAPHEQEKYRVILTSTPTAEERTAVWKARHREERLRGQS